MTEYRFVTPTMKGSWHPTRAAALDDAARAGYGHRDEGGTFFSHPFMRIQDRPDERDELRAQLDVHEDAARRARYNARAAPLHSKISRDAHRLAREHERAASEIRRRLGVPD